MNEIIKSLRERKSVRSFTKEGVSGEVKELLFEAAFQAPTAGCQQLYTILDITDQKKKDTLAELCDHQPFIAAAPVVLVFLADCRRWQDGYEAAGLTPRAPGMGDILLATQDGVIAAQNVVVAAESLGLGSCYIGDIVEHGEQVKELLELPDMVYPCCMLVIGWPTQGAKERRKPERFDGKFIVHENSYRRFGKEELAEMFTPRRGEQDFETWMKAFCERKYHSEFSLEMSRSAGNWLKPFQNGGKW